MRVPRGVLRWWTAWRAKRAFEAPAPAPIAKLQGRELAIDGMRFRVAKVVGGPLPVVLLSPLGLTKRSLLRSGQRLRRVKRQMDRETAFVREQIDREIRGF